MIRIPESLDKNHGIKNIYSTMKDVPSIIFDVLDEERMRLEEAQNRFGDYYLTAIFYLKIY